MLANEVTATHNSSRSAAWWQWLGVPANQLLVLLLVLAAFPLLADRERTPMQLWDESRLAMSALEMSRGGSWLVVSYDGRPEHWSVKPPLLIWQQALAFKLFGYHTWAFRIPTTLAAFGTLVLLFRFAATRLRLPLAGFVGGLVLITAAGYVRLHGARTGDYDVPLAFWETVAWIAFFDYLEAGRTRQLYWVGGALVAAVLTKGVAGLLGGPALLAYALLRGRLGWLLRQPRLYAVAAAGLAVVAGYYLGREALDPGYLALVRENELSGRFGQVIEGHGGFGDFYFTTLYSPGLGYWLWGLPLAGLAWLQPDRQLRRAATMLLLFALGWLPVLSGAATKIDWYAIPAYPPLALLIGLGVALAYNKLLSINALKIPPVLAKALQLALLALVCYFPLQRILGQVELERDQNLADDSDAQLAYYLTDTVAHRPIFESLDLLSKGGYNSALSYYYTVLNGRDNRQVRFHYLDEYRRFPAGMVLLVCDPAYRVRLDSFYRITPLHQDYPCETIMLMPK